MARSTKKSKKKVARSVLCLKVNLVGVEDPVWRRVLVPADISLGALHRTLNEVMGWHDAHLHQFTVGKVRFGAVDIDDDQELEDENAVTLESLVKEKSRFMYQYDFGDDWAHEVVVEKRFAWDQRLHYPVCIGGARACPPEDCGGPPGYAHLLEVLANDEGPEHDEILTWLGGFFDPEGFDVNRTNLALWAAIDSPEP